MKIKVYQINGDLDSHRTKFFSYDSTIQEAGRVDPSIYKTVFDACPFDVNDSFSEAFDIYLGTVR